MASSNIDAFNQEKALVGAFSVIVKTDGSFAALPTTRQIRNERLYTPENIGGNFYTSLPIFTDIAEGGKYTG